MIYNSLMRFKKLNKNSGKTYLYIDRDGNRLTEKDLEGYDPLVLSVDTSLKNQNEVFVFLDIYASQMNLASKKINEMNLSPADLKVINNPVDKIYQYFIEIEAIPVIEYKSKIKELDEHFSNKIKYLCKNNSRLTNHELADGVLCEIIEIFGLRKTLDIYKEEKQK